VRKAFEAYVRVNRRPPSTIVIYRDGVGEGQMKTVLDNEVADIENWMSEIMKGHKPKLAYIVVNKLLSERFSVYNSNAFQNNGNLKDLFNPPTGTVVANKITSSYFDFFLCAQYVNRGTCTPTHYSVL